jgi:hypothetical protein
MGVFTEHDENKGMVKVYWADVCKRVEKVEPTFAKIVSELNPDKSFPLYLAYYPYGAIDADTESSLFPDMKGGYYRLSDVNAPKEIVTNLGYSINNTPLGMVLEKQIESFIDLKNERITIPWLIYTPGKFFPFTRILSKKTNRIYAPNGLLSSAAGARSIFMLPNIGCATNHLNLQRDFNVKNSAPKSLYDHWAVFKEIINSEIVNSDWRCCVMYFSEKWITKIHQDKKWSELKQYLYETAWRQFEYEINRVFYDAIFSVIQQTRNLKPNPYLVDTAKHLFAMVLGAAPGYVPASNDEALPLASIQDAYVNSYGIKKYITTVMQPRHFHFEDDKLPIYYSLQHPSTFVFSPKSREVSSTISEMRELEHIMNIFIQEVSKNNSMSDDTVFSKVARNMKINYFHNKIDRHRVVQASSQIPLLDKRFTQTTTNQCNLDGAFASDAPFMRGCVSITVNNV